MMLRITFISDRYRKCEPLTLIVQAILSNFFKSWAASEAMATHVTHFLRVAIYFQHTAAALLTRARLVRMQWRMYCPT